MLSRATIKKQFILVATGMLVFLIACAMSLGQVEKVTFIVIADPK